MPTFPSKPSKIVLAMSGGVDSSVAAWLLKEQGHEVVGCFMRLGSDESSAEACSTSSPPGRLDGEIQGQAQAESLSKAESERGKHGENLEGGGGGNLGGGCCSVNDAADARLVAAMLDIPFYVLNFRRDFGRIIDYFQQEYHAGRTPNPCVRCNDWLKFGKLLDYARSIDADYIATGHYAQVDHTGQTPRLLRGLDTRKDQSYVLFGSTLDRLKRMLLPVGAMTKPEVRRLAQQQKLPVFDKPDSQEICFVPNDDYAAFLQANSPDRFHPGDILDPKGRVVGQHPGHQHFTIGQRRGLNLALGYPVYVVSKDAQGNTITVGQKEMLTADGLIADQVNWLIDPPTSPMDCQAKVRYNSPPVPAQVCVSGPDELTVRFTSPVTAISPGQAVVCYQADQVIGGGWIRGATF